LIDFLPSTAETKKLPIAPENRIAGIKLNLGNAWGITKSGYFTAIFSLIFFVKPI
jgi:hypothetical protein